MDAHETVLLRLIDRLLAGELPFDEYEGAYKDYYLERMPEAAIADESRVVLFSAALERLDWTDQAPDEESRRYGWRDGSAYIAWLRTARAEWRNRFGGA